MSLPFTAEKIKNPDNGESYRVLDVSHVDFSAAITGRKSAETLVRRAAEGERIETRNTAGKLETTYVTKAGDAIFTNLHDAADVYVPGNPDGTRWKFDQLQEKGYEITAGSLKSGEVRVRSAETFKILHEAVEENTCIKNAWGEGQHQFLYKGATLKLNNNGLITGIDKSAFDGTWEVIKRAAKSGVQPKAHKLKS